MVAGDVGVDITNIVGLNSNMFDGVDDYVEITHNEAQLGKNLTNGLTISAWINPRSLGENNLACIIAKGEDTNALNGFQLQMVTTNGVRWRCGGVSNNINGLTFGSWTHVLVTSTYGGVVNIYFNGIVVSAGAVGGLLNTIITTQNPRIGNRPISLDRTFDGSIKDVKMWNRVLSSTEIAQDYAGTTPQNGLIHHFKLGGDYTDYGSVGVTATNSGSQPVIVEGGTTTTAIKNLRTLCGISGAFMICPTGRRKNQIMQVGIQQT